MIGRTWYYASTTPIKDMGINHHRFDIFMTQKLLDGANVVALFQKVGGKAMPKGMTAPVFGDPRLLDSLSHGTLHGLFIEMVSS